MSIDLARFQLRTSDDLAGLTAALAQFGPKRVRKLALFLRVPGEYEDGSREKARAAVETLLAEHGLAEHAEMVIVVGCEGATTPCAFVLADLKDDGGSHAQPRLAIGVAHGTPPADGDLDKASFAREVADLVRTAVEDGGMAPHEVVTAFVNTPSPTVGDKAARGRRARAVAALGAGIALGEIETQRVTDAAIGANPSLYTRRVQTFTGPTVKQVEVIVLGNRPGAGGRFMACTTVTNDLLDVRPLKRMLVGTGLQLDADGELAEPERVVAALVKSGVGANGHVLGQPTVIFRGGIPPEKHVRAAQSGVFGAVLKTTCMFNTYDPIQQAPEGGSQACCIVRL
jgi:cyanuric acid amidohydrolase